tara:strand:+ start:608 stop:1744 length:1137 start_codon:yes stop_codon:yes gene_type:complete
MNKMRILRRLTGATIGVVRYISFILGSTVLLLTLGHIALGLLPVKNAPAVPYFNESQIMRELYKETEQAVAMDFAPYYHWKGIPFSGKLVNIDDNGNRKTIKDPSPGATRIFCMGGSTMWGRGLPDPLTIPSILQQQLGTNFDVHNFGEQAFVSVQELNYLLEKLAFGQVPEVVIFYDGVNDGYAGVYSPAIPRDPQTVRLEHHQRIERQRSEDFWNLLGRAVFNKTNYRLVYEYGQPDLPAWGRQVKTEISDNVTKTLDAYEAFVRQAQAVAREYDFEVFFFWQPNIYSLGKPLTPYEEQILADSDAILVESQKMVYEEARRRFTHRNDIHFLGDIFNEVEKEIYIDFCHTRPRGNRIIAAEMVQVLRRHWKLREGN